MNDSGQPSRLDMLRFLERVQEQDLARTRAWIEREERAAVEAQRRRRAEEARRPPEGDWILSGRPARGATVWLHVGGCWDVRAGMLTITRAQAVEALTQGGAEACPACRPDRELGLLE